MYQILIFLSQNSNATECLGNAEYVYTQITNGTVSYDVLVHISNTQTFARS